MTRADYLEAIVWGNIHQVLHREKTGRFSTYYMEDFLQENAKRDNFSARQQTLRFA